MKRKSKTLLRNTPSDFEYMTVYNIMKKKKKRKKEKKKKKREQIEKKKKFQVPMKLRKLDKRKTSKQKGACLVSLLTRFKTLFYLL